MSKRLFIVTGDASGDIHAANAVRELWKLDSSLEIEAVGGVRLREAGVPLLADQSRMGRVGFGSVMGAPYHYFLGRKIIKRLKTFRPDVVLLIDYGVFNLYLAKQIKKLGIPVCYFIPPQVWASRKGRIKKIQAGIDHVFCIFPFEEALYREHGVPVTFVGHPLVGQLPPSADRQAFCEQYGLDPAKPIVGLFPGSRKSEIGYLLDPVLMSLPRILKLQPDTQFVLAKSDALSDDYFYPRYNALMDAMRRELREVPVKVIERANHAVLSVSDMLIAASGTVTLEAALYKTPMVIIYRGSRLVYEVFLRLCYLPCIGLPNILSGLSGALTGAHDPIVPELLQDRANPEAITQALMPFYDPESSESLKARTGFERIEAMLGEKSAPENLARELKARFLK